MRISSTDEGKAFGKSMRRLDSILKNTSVLYVVLLDLIAVYTAWLIYTDSGKRPYFALLPLMPLTYMAAATLCWFLFKSIPDNLGVTMMLAFEALKMVIIPLVIHLSGYYEYFGKKPAETIPKSILLMVYECAAVFAVMALCHFRNRRSKTQAPAYTTNEKKYWIILLVLLVVTAILIAIAPQSLAGYRMIFGVGDEEFTHLDVSELISTLSTGFVSRLAMVLVRNFAIVLRILLPGAVIIALSKIRFGLPLSVIMAVTPFLIVDDAIGRSLYYTLILFYLIYYVYKPRYAKELITAGGVLAIVFLAVYWKARYSANESTYGLYTYLSRVLNNYFGGLFMVTGTIEMDATARSKVLFFIADILKSVPFGNTIFRVGHIRYFQGFFNQINSAYGKIPPTIGIGRFYFGYALAPLYSCIFAAVSALEGEKAITDPNPYRKMTHLLAAVIFAFGFSMYTVQPTYSLFFYIVIPSMLITWLCREKKAQNKSAAGKREEKTA